jgi:phage tail-like protein
MATTPVYPLTTLHFQVTWGDSQNTVSFSEVSGLTLEADAIDYRGGADVGLSVQKIPGLLKYGAVKFARGIAPAAAGNGLFDWYKTHVAGSVERRDVTVSLLNEELSPVMVWKLKRAWPSKLEGPGLKGSGNEIAIESMELIHEGIEIEVL